MIDRKHNHHELMVEDFRNRFWISLILSFPIILLSPMVQLFLGFSLTFEYSIYVLFAFSSIVFFYGGWPFLKGFYFEIRKREPGMMVLISVAIISAYLYSSAIVFGLEGKLFFWETTTLIVIMLLGHWIEMKSIIGASKALKKMIEMMPTIAHGIIGQIIVDIEVKDLKINDKILIKPGEKVPADGVVFEGLSYINESMLTGEPIPIKKGLNDSVIAGSLNGDGALKIKVKHKSDDSYLFKVIGLIEETQKTKSKTQNLGNQAAKWLTYIALIAGFTTLIVWLLLGYEFSFALERMVTVMVISCPHALGLAIPLVVAISTTAAAQKGLLIRNRTAFENSRKIDLIVFDKTGTLTNGKFEITRYESLSDNFSQDDILRISSSLEQYSDHPISVAIMKKAKELGVVIPNVSDFISITGKGVEGVVEGAKVRIVSPGFLKDEDSTIPEEVYGIKAETVVFLVLDRTVIGFIAVSDELRHNALKTVQRLKKQNIKVYMATGDNNIVAKEVSKKLGLDGYYSEVLPHQKVEIVKEFQENGSFVAMTGDGINDAPALAKADVGIAIGSGTDIAVETADIILVNSDPKDILGLIQFGELTYNKMVQNLIWATAYNVVSIPLAAGVLISYGFVLSPALGAILMSLSTVIVALNAQLLKRQIKKLWFNNLISRS